MSELITLQEIYDKPNEEIKDILQIHKIPSKSKIRNIIKKKRK